MKYFKNVELAKMYKVSKKTITNWVDGAKGGKVKLKLYEEAEKFYIANTPENHLVIEGLVTSGRKFKNKKVFKSIIPKKEFYNVFGDDQVIDIINTLETYHEIGHQYSYFDGGAEYWDRYTKKLLESKTSNALTNTLNLLSLNLNYLNILTNDYEKVNLVDIGGGNAIPVKDVIKFLINKEKFNKYIGIDYSNEMLKVAEKNLKEWFGNDFPFEAYVKNIQYERFQNVLFKDSESLKDFDSCLNLVFFLGSIASCLKNPQMPFETIKSSMKSDDLLVYNIKLDTVNARRYFDFSADNIPTKLVDQDRLVPDLLNIDESFYDVEQIYDKKENERTISIILNVDIELSFETKTFRKKIYLNNGDKIILWRSKHQSYDDVLKQFSDTGFEVLSTMRSKDTEEMLLIAKVKQK